MQPKIFFFAFVMTGCSLTSFSQQQLNIATGLSFDMNDSNKGKFLNVPIVLQYLPTSSHRVSFLINANVQLPIWNNAGHDSGFSISATPHATSFKKTIQSFNYAVNFGLRINFPIPKNQHVFLDLLPLGFCQQQFTVKYKNYNSSQYDILNPDVNLDKSGFVMSLGTGYIYKKFFCEITIQTPLLIINKPQYELSYKYAAPLQLIAGYSFNLKKHKK